MAADHVVLEALGLLDGLSSVLHCLQRCGCLADGSQGCIGICPNGCQDVSCTGVLGSCVWLVSIYRQLVSQSMCHRLSRVPGLHMRSAVTVALYCMQPLGHGATVHDKQAVGKLTVLRKACAAAVVPLPDAACKVAFLVLLLASKASCSTPTGQSLPTAACSNTSPLHLTTQSTQLLCTSLARIRAHSGC